MEQRRGGTGGCGVAGRLGGWEEVGRSGVMCVRRSRIIAGAVSCEQEGSALGRAWGIHPAASGFQECTKTSTPLCAFAQTTCRMCDVAACRTAAATDAPQRAEWHCNASDGL